MIGGVHDTPTGGAIAHRVIGEGLRIEQERMAGGGQAIQLITAKRLRPSAIRQAGPVADPVIDIVRLVDLAAGGGQLMQNVGDLTCRIVGIGQHGKVTAYTRSIVPGCVV